MAHDGSCFSSMCFLFSFYYCIHFSFFGELDRQTVERLDKFLSALYRLQEHGNVYFFNSHTFFNFNLHKLTMYINFVSGGWRGTGALFRNIFLPPFSTSKALRGESKRWFLGLAESIRRRRRHYEMRKIKEEMKQKRKGRGTAAG